eukprot:UN09705
MLLNTTIKYCVVWDKAQKLLLSDVQQSKIS